MGFLKPTFFLLAVNLLAAPVAGRTITNCFVSNFDDAEITYTYSNEGADGDLEITVEFGGSAQTGPLTVTNPADANPAMHDNYVITGSCNTAFRFCKAHVGILYYHSVRQEIAKADGDVSLAIKDSNQAADPVQCKIDGRNLVIVAPENGLANAGEADTLSTGVVQDTQNKFMFPIDAEIDSFVRGTDATVAGARFTYSDGSGSTGQDLGSATSYGAVDSFVASDVTRVLITSYTDGGFCGLILQNGADSNLVNYNGCGGNATDAAHIVDISAGYRLAGFMQFGTTDVKLVPVLYQRLTPRVMMYEAVEAPNAGLKFYVKSFFDVETSSYSVSYMTGLSQTDGTAQMTSTTDVSISLASSAAEFTVVPTDTTCGCYSVDVTLTSAVPSGDTFQYSGQLGFKAFTPEFKATSENFGLTGNDQMTGTSFVTHSAGQDDKCPGRYPKYYATGATNDEMYLDGWIGARPAGELMPTNAVEITKPIIKLDVYGSTNGNDATITGMELTLAGDTSPSITIGAATGGTVDGTLLETFEAPENTYLLYITAHGDANDADIVRGITAYYGQPRAPCFVVSIAAESYSPDLPNADMRKVYWYAPSDYTKVVADITGKLVADTSEMLSAEVVPADGAAEFDRGQIYSAYLFHLKPNTGYSFTLMGTTLPVASVSGFTLDSEDTTAVQFTTDEGIYLQCTIGGPSASVLPRLTNKIDWSAVPEVEIKYEESDVVQEADGSTVASTSDAKNAQSFPVDSYFHYLAGQTPNHPAFDEFRGYPKAVHVYHDENNCIKVLALDFEFSSGNTQQAFIAGDAESVAGLADDSVFFTDRVTKIGASFDNDGNGNCLTAIGFTEVGGVTSSCLNNNVAAEDCGEKSSGAPSSDFHMSSLSASVDSEGRVVAFSATWVSVDIPTLQSEAQSTSGCGVTFNEAYWNIRGSDWELTYDLNARNNGCGTYSALDGTTHVLTYSDLVTRARDQTSGNIDGEGVTITRSNAWEVASTCKYNAEGEVASSFETKGEAAYHMVDLHAIEFSLAIYKDHTFTETYSPGSSPMLNLGETLYLATSINDNLDNYVVKNFECYATESADPSVKDNYYALSTEDGCPDDDSFTWDEANSNGHRDAFHFDSFAWVKTQNGESVLTVDTVYVHCTVRACPTTPAGSDDTCQARGTNCPAADRARRDLSGLLPEGVKERTVTLDTPIFVKRRDTETLTINRDPIMIEDRSMTVASLFGLFATVTFFCLMVIGYRIHTVRKGYYRLKEERFDNSAAH